MDSTSVQNAAMSIPKKKLRSFKKTSEYTPHSKLRQKKLSQSMQHSLNKRGVFKHLTNLEFALMKRQPHKLQLHEPVEVVNSLHSNISVGMIGKITGFLEEGYEVYFEKPNVSETFKGLKPSPVHMMMRFGDVTPFVIENEKDLIH